MKSRATELTPRLRSLYKGGARFVALDPDDTWGVGADDLRILLLRLRDSKWKGIYRIEGTSRGGRHMGRATHVERVSTAELSPLLVDIYAREIEDDAYEEEKQRAERAEAEVSPDREDGK